MSDFDREAEREKLREKYERDKQKREASERMSELLLQGATMTNRHCPECQSPVFRYDGREFCPTCENEVTEDGELLGAGEGAASAEETDDDGTEPSDTGVGIEATDSSSTPESDNSAAPGTAGGSEANDGVGVEAADAGERSDLQDGAPPAPSDDRRPARVDPPANREPEGGQEKKKHDDNRGRRGEPGAERGTLREAERTLVAEVGSLTRRAEETRDVGRKRDLLAAAREAAETLEAVRRL